MLYSVVQNHFRSVKSALTSQLNEVNISATINMWPVSGYNSRVAQTFLHFHIILRH